MNLDFYLTDYISEKEIRYCAMFNAVTDCIYRTAVIDNLKYVGVADLDEIFMPKGNESLVKLLKRHEDNKAHSYEFVNAFFLKKYGQDYASVPENLVSKFLNSNEKRNLKKKSFQRTIFCTPK